MIEAAAASEPKRPEHPSCSANPLSRGELWEVWCPFRPWVVDFRILGCDGCPYFKEPVVASHHRSLTDMHNAAVAVQREREKREREGYAEPLTDEPEPNGPQWQLL